MPAPLLTVLITTRNRETRLSFALEGLAAQTLDPDRFEVVVVRADDTRGPLAEAPEGLRVRFLIHSGQPGPAAQRNAGWRVAQAPIVAFTDDDCRADPRWLEYLVAAAGAGDVIVQGRTEPDPDERHLLIGLARSLHVDRPNDWFATCNIAYPAALLEQLGGFDEAFRFSAEDADLGLRAREAGARTVFEHRALIFHAVLPESLAGAIREACRRDATPRLFARHPGHRGALHYGVFWKKEHAALLLASAGLVAFRRRPALAAAAIFPYLNCYVDWRRAVTPRGFARIALNLSGRVAIDAAELAVTARGAVAERVLVL